MSRAVLAIGLLTAVYLLVLASIDPWDVVVGAAVSAALLTGTRSFVAGDAPGAEPGMLSRVLGFVPFGLAVIWEMTKGTLQVTLVVLHLRPLLHPGIVAMPMEERTRLGVAVWALSVALSPGSFPVDFDWEQRVMFVHVLDASDPDALRADQRRLYDRFQRRVFP